MGGVCLGHPATIWCASFGRDPILVLISMALDLPDNPAIHTMFLFLFVVSMLTLFLAVFCDSGSCATETKEGLKPVRTIPSLLQDIVRMSNFLIKIIEDLVRRNCLDTFCIKCRVSSATDLLYFAFALTFVSG